MSPLGKHDRLREGCDRFLPLASRDQIGSEWRRAVLRITGTNPSAVVVSANRRRFVDRIERSLPSSRTASRSSRRCLSSASTGSAAVNQPEKLGKPLVSRRRLKRGGVDGEYQVRNRGGKKKKKRRAAGASRFTPASVSFGVRSDVFPVTLRRGEQTSEKSNQQTVNRLPRTAGSQSAQHTHTHTQIHTDTHTQVNCSEEFPLDSPRSSVGG